MKKWIRIVSFSLLFLAGAGFITWYLLMRRQVPQHAQCIPKNVIAVLTLNLRELALDRATGGHLFPELKDKQFVSKELERFTKVLEKNDGSGIAETADVLAFFYMEDSAGFFGISASLKDSAKFGKLVREQLAAEFSVRPFLSKKSSLVRLDTSSAIMGWNNDLVLFLYPVSNESAEKTAAQCTKLLAQTVNQSILSDENFKTHELSSFDAGLWMQPQQLLKFTGEAALLRTSLADIKYLSLAMDFQDGELVMRRIITTEKISGVHYDAPVLLTCDPKQVLGFYHAVLDLQNDSLIDEYVDAPPLNMLPVSDERARLLASHMDGNFTLLVHDTFSYNMDFITYEYDADFNPIPVHGTKRETTRGLTASFGLKNKAAAQELLTAWMKADSIPFHDNTWTIDDHGSKHYLVIAENVLTISSWKQADGKPREVPPTWQELDLFLPMDKVLVPELTEKLSFFFPQIGKGETLLSEHLENILVSKPLIIGNERSSQIRVTMKNRQVNALVQLEELFGKIAAGN